MLPICVRFGQGFIVLQAVFSPLTYLKTLPYFEGVDECLLLDLADQTVQRTFGAGEVLFLEGDPGAGLWIIEQGRVKVYKVNADGLEHVLRIFGDRDTFNDIPALDAGPNPANAATLSESVLWVLPHTALQVAAQRDSRLSANVIRILAGRVRGLIRQIEDLALYSVVVRLARFLIQQTEDRALSGPGVTRAAIAAHLATTPQTISTVLRELEVAGAIRFNRHEIAIVDVTLLRSIAML
jgi:CRP/FNR family transcriptional regulator